MENLFNLQVLFHSKWGGGGYRQYTPVYNNYILNAPKVQNIKMPNFPGGNMSPDLFKSCM